jgi:hypothetical protein
VTCREITVSGDRWRLCPIDRPVEAHLVRAVVRARVIDELTGQPPGPPLSLRTSAPLTPHAVGGGRVGLIGAPGRVFPGLAAATVEVDLAIAVRGFLPRHERWNLGPIPGYPASFAVLDGGELALHRPGTSLRGRVASRASGTWVPVAGAKVALTGYWEQEPSSSMAVPSSPPDLVALRRRLYARRPAGSIARHRELAVDVGNAKTLRAPASAGARSLRLSDRIAVAPGDLCAVDWADPDRAEYLEITDVQGASTPDQPCTVSVAHPLDADHDLGAAAAPAVIGAAGGDNLLLRAGLEGDRVVYLDGLVGLAAPTTIEIDGGAAGPEYHLTRRFEAVTDGEGYYRLPPLARAARVRIAASDGVTTAERLLSPDYTAAECVVDLELA